MILSYFYHQTKKNIYLFSQSLNGCLQQQYINFTFFDLFIYRADQKNLKERRSKQKSTSISPRETIERDLVGSANNHYHHQEKPHHHHRSKKSSSVSPTQKRRHRRQKSPHPGASQKNKDQQHPLVQVIANSGIIVIVTDHRRFRVLEVPQRFFFQIFFAKTETKFL